MFFRFSGYRTIISLMIVLSSLTLFLPLAAAQENNVCRDTDATVIAPGEVLTGFLNPNFPIIEFCFDAERGTDVTITITPATQNLLTVLVVGTPFVDNNGLFVDDVLVLEESPEDGSPYSGTATITSDGTYLISVQGAQNVQGAFDISLEVSSGNVLGSTTPTEESDTSSTTDNTTEIIPDDDGITTVDEIVFGSTDLCTVDVTGSLVFGETVEGSGGDIEPAFYCFDASAGDIITAEFNITSEVPMGYVVVDPLYDGTPASIVYSQGFVQLEGETFTDEFFIDRDDRYALIVFSIAEGATGEFSLSLDAVAANIYTCDNEPLNTLTSREWGMLAEDGTALIEINIACSPRLSFAAFGGALITQYSITQQDEFYFVYQNRLYTTISLSEEEWIIQREDGVEFTLQTLSEPDACSDEALQLLIGGSWLWSLDATQSIFFDFTCNGIVLIDDNQNPPIAGGYDYTGDSINITIGDQLITFTSIVAAEELITADFNGIVVELQNILYEAEATEE